MSGTLMKATRVTVQFTKFNFAHLGERIAHSLPNYGTGFDLLHKKIPTVNFSC